MKTIQKLSALVIVTALASCSSSKFTSRKYTSGKFIAQRSSVKHNTIFADTTKAYAFLSNTIELKKTTKPATENTDREIILKITKSIIKKDSVFRIQRRGKDKIIAKKCDGVNVLIILNSRRQIIKIKKEGESINALYENNTAPTYSMKCLLLAERAMKPASILWFLPIVGIILVAKAIRKIKNAEVANPEYNFNKEKNKFRGLLFLSLITTIGAIIGGFAYYINFIYVPMGAVY